MRSGSYHTRSVRPIATRSSPKVGRRDADPVILGVTDPDGSIGSNGDAVRAIVRRPTLSALLKFLVYVGDVVVARAGGPCPGSVFTGNMPIPQAQPHHFPHMSQILIRISLACALCHTDHEGRVLARGGLETKRDGNPDMRSAACE
jgi:hypothetical protein